MTLFIFMLMVSLLLFILQDVIAVKMGWFIIPSPERRWYVMSTIGICFIIRLIGNLG